MRLRSDRFVYFALEIRVYFLSLFDGKGQCYSSLTVRVSTIVVSITFSIFQFFEYVLNVPHIFIVTQITSHINVV